VKDFKPFLSIEQCDSSIGFCRKNVVVEIAAFVEISKSKLSWNFFLHEITKGKFFQSIEQGISTRII